MHALSAHNHSPADVVHKAWRSVRALQQLVMEELDVEAS